MALTTRYTIQARGHGSYVLVSANTGNSVATRGTRADVITYAKRMGIDSLIDGLQDGERSGGTSLERHAIIKGRIQ